MASSTRPINLTHEANLYLFHHIFLPPKLPQADDYNSLYEINILDYVVNALLDFGSHVSNQEATIFTTITTMVSRLREICNFPDGINEKELKTSLKQLDQQGGFLPIYVREQNAGILMTRNKDAIHIESFELSPLNKHVMATVGRLQREFPGPTLALDLATFNEPGFCETLIQTLGKMSRQSVAGTKPHVIKAGQLHDEDRDTTDPRMVTQLIMTFIRPRCTNAVTLQIQKNTRDEVMWKNSRSPWRRSSLWLLVRVVLQLAFCRLTDETKGDDLYKRFMVYFMSSVVNASLRLMPSENIHLMNSKIGRRLLKLNLSEEPSWFSSVQEISSQTSKAVEDSWRATRTKNSRQLDLQSLTYLKFEQDAHFTLPDLDQYLKEIENRAQSQNLTAYLPEARLPRLCATELPLHQNFGDEEHKTHNLAAFEDWVASSLDAWLKSHQTDRDTCAQLAHTMTHYQAAASTSYSGNPEAVSVMILTLVELWIACDRSALYAYEMLSEYDACIPVEIFQSLVLPFRSQMARLAHVEEYLHQRQQRIKYRGTEIFEAFGTRSSFSVRYFDQSEDHQELRRRIEDLAEKERREKKLEFKQKRAEYNRLQELVGRTECTYHEVVVDSELKTRESRHSASCLRCAYESSASSIKIDVHEWPLSANCLQAKSTVFELRVPQSFGCWRDATMFLLFAVLKRSYSCRQSPRSKHSLQGYQGLSLYFIDSGSDPRVGLLSEVKPHTSTHRNARPIISVTEDDVCLHNGLRFRYFDNSKGCFVTSLQCSSDVERSCTYPLPLQCSSLQQFLFRPGWQPDGPSPNTVIATQSSAPTSMSTEEYKALATIPLGVEIQWQNILLQLAAPSVDFKKVETAVFILQVINQAGPSQTDSEPRKGHKIVSDHEFALKILCLVQETAGQIKENWELAHGLSTLVFLVQRILCISSFADIQKFCLDILGNLRQIAWCWINLVNDKMAETANVERRTDFAGKSAHLALVCAETYNLEGQPTIFTIPSDLSILIQCYILIHDRIGFLPIESCPIFPILHHRWQTSTYRCHSILANMIVNRENPGMDMAIKSSWSAFCTESRWSLALEHEQSWLVIPATSTFGHEVMVHFNLLSGELLINGLALDRLPKDYERHESYQKLFRNSHIEVMPSHEPGMRFSCRRKYLQHVVHLGKGHGEGSKEPDLFVLAVKDDQTWEFIPPRLFRRFFPDDFVENCTHWYSVNDGDVEFRPTTAPWISSESNWRLKRNRSQNTWYLQKGESVLIGMKSQTARLVSAILEPVEKASKLHCSLQNTTSNLTIHIPRLRLEFTLQPQSSSIHSRQYPEMEIDAKQSLGCLIGLQSKLVLTHQRSHNQVVLIPEGYPFFKRVESHVEVSIVWQSKTTLHAYSVDKFLGRLIESGSLQSKLFLCYLHALTSFCLPDPLTSKTGTEQALSILRSSSVQSFDQIKADNGEILEMIAALSPLRKYYPEDCKEMQSINWQDELGVLSQHGGFYTEAKAILERAHRMEMFYPNNKSSFPTQPWAMEEGLLKRAQIRSASFLVSGFGAEDYTQKYDKHYAGRGNDYSPKCSHAFSICKILYESIPRTSGIAVERLLERLWAFLCESDLVHGPKIQIDVSDIQYDSKLMLDSKKFVAESWCSLHRLICSPSQRPCKFQVMMWLSTIAYAGHVPEEILETLASFWVVPNMQFILPPFRQSFKPREGIQVNTAALRSQLRLKNIEATPEWKLGRNEHENNKSFLKRRTRAMKTNQDRAADEFLADLKNQWPKRKPTEPQSQESLQFNDYISVDSSMKAVCGQFIIWWDNGELRTYLSEVVSLLGIQVAQSVRCPPISIPSQAKSAPRLRAFVSFDDLLRPTSALEFASPQLPSVLRTSVLDEAPASQLVALMDSLDQQAKSTHEQWYVRQLRHSVASLQQTKTTTEICVKNDVLERVIADYLSQCQEYADAISEAVISQMTPGSRINESSRASNIINCKVLGVLAGMKQWPRLSPTLLLEQLTRHRWPVLSDDWKKTFISYGRSLTMLQHAQRLASHVKSPDELSRELSNPGHTTWDPFEFPESLLLEVESGILIREPQDRIARQMRASASGENTVMQLNMGEGKSSVIVPIVAATLANGSCLVRVFVAKPQSRQMFHMLVSKLGGLLGRRVFHMPISRSLKLDQAGANELKSLCLECMSQGGVLLVQPEHVLSLKLMCLEYFILGNISVAQSLLEILRFFHTFSRDVVDESDENFNVKFELIYTMGLQNSVELSPQRWVLIQQLLKLVHTYAPTIEERFPQSIQLDRQAAIPRIRLLRQDAEQALLQCVAKHICEIGIDSLPISRQPKSVRDAVFAYVTNLDLTTDGIAAVESSAGFWTETTKGPLLLLRGLLAHGVLAFCFGQKRWRVNYGPDTTRNPPTRLCVPYKAKDSPSPRSEFSHPDVVIVLTSLNYYYAGLSDDDLFLAFNHLVRSDQADIEYQLWVNNASLEKAYRQLVGVNLEDRHHCVEHIFPALRFSKVVIDYFLSQIVFPKEIKEFPDKLSASGWDLGETKTQPTAGFSGTNDSRKTLPLNIKQLDLPEQDHTNALVLEYLLEPENSVTFISEQNPESKSDAHVLLETVAALDPPVQVILDVGAQVLELDNLQLASCWLEMLPKDGQTQAIVFINDSDEICVLDQSGRVEPLHTSPFARQMEACFVFLDEAHTRGIDLKLPSNYRAAVTLGAGITKDKLVQACMRMRKLGKGQSVVFCIPREIEFKILGLTRKRYRSNISVRDVLSWAVSETWIETQRHIPLWAVQGRRFEHQLGLWYSAGKDVYGGMTSTQARKFLEPESQSLDVRYRPGHGDGQVPQLPPNKNKNLELISERCREFRDAGFASTTLQEEQERELTPEIERERQVQRPPQVTPAQHLIHPRLRSFVSTGNLIRSSDAFLPAFQTLQSTSAMSHLDLSQFPTGLLATRDFATTIEKNTGTSLITDSFQRPVGWILTRAHPDRNIVAEMVIISPHEANVLMPEIRESTKVSLHSYAPRLNQGHRPLDRLTLYNVGRKDAVTIPDDLRMQLNLFAGQLYLDSFSEYQALCDFLGVATVKTADDMVVAADGFILRGGQDLKTPFTQSPLKFLSVLLSQIRKDCQKIDKTHMGQILDGQLLSPSDFPSSEGSDLDMCL